MTSHNDSFTRVRYELPRPGVARITLARPEAANAQDYLLLSELNQAYDLAAQDDEVKVIVLAADGKHFSSGHDLRDAQDMSELPVVGTECHFHADGSEGTMAREAEMYLGLCWRWRNIPKPTIASVQGKVIAGGLMLVWPLDLIVCADDASFSDPVVAFGVNGIEYFSHAYELPIRVAKDMLFAGKVLSADEALHHGMINKVVPRADLESETLDYAEQVATRPAFGLSLAKKSLNQSQEAMGLSTALQAAFSLHHIGHSHNKIKFGIMVDPGGADIIRAESRK